MVYRFFGLPMYGLLLFALIHYAEAQTTSGENNVKGYPVFVEDDTLFFVYKNLGPFSATIRASENSMRIKKFFNSADAHTDSIFIIEQADLLLLMYGNEVLFSVSEEDARFLSQDKKQLAEQYRENLINSFNSYKEKYSTTAILYNVGYSLGIFFAAILLLYLFKLLFVKVYSNIEKLEAKFVKSVAIKNIEILSSEIIIIVFLSFAKLVRLALTLILLNVTLNLIFKLLPWTSKWNTTELFEDALIAIFLTMVGFFLLKGNNGLAILIENKLNEWKGSLIKGISIRKLNLISDEKIADILFFINKILKFFITIIILYFYFTIIFSLFDYTRNWAGKLFRYFIDPIVVVLNSIIAYLPSLFFIAVIIFATRYIIKFVKMIFTEIENGNIPLSGFQTDWAMPTFKLIRFLIVVFSVIIIYPYLPGSDSKAFEGVGVILGLMLSFASASAISNVVSGTVLTYLSAFNLGDRVKIADTIGDVVGKTLLATRIKTVKNVEITIPNSIVLGNHIINFSKSARSEGLILHTTITIGYDVPWKKVHELLISAAKSTEGLLAKPEPFVLQKSLDDYYVSYELNVYTDNANRQAAFYSALHGNIQDKFNEAGVEILSPGYSAIRDGNQTTIPEDYLPKNYNAPAFRLFNLGGKKPESD